MADFINVWRLSVLWPTSLTLPEFQLNQDAVPSASDFISGMGLTGTSNAAMTEVTATFYLLSYEDAAGRACVAIAERQHVYDPPNAVAQSVEE